MHHSSCCARPVDPASLPEVCLPLQSGPRRNDPVWPSPWASGQVSGPPCCVGYLQWHIYVFKLAKEKNVASTTGPSTFCASWFGGHLGPAPAPRHNANRYCWAVYYQAPWDAQPRAKSSPLYTLYIYIFVSYYYHPFLNCQLESVCSRTMLHNVCQSVFLISVIGLRTRNPVRRQVVPVWIYPPWKRPSLFLLHIYHFPSLQQYTTEHGSAYRAIIRDSDTKDILDRFTCAVVVEFHTLWPQSIRCLNGFRYFCPSLTGMATTRLAKQSARVARADGEPLKKEGP